VVVPSGLTESFGFLQLGSQAVFGWFATGNTVMTHRIPPQGGIAERSAVARIRPGGRGSSTIRSQSNRVGPSGLAKEPSGSMLAPNTKYRAVRRRVSVTCARFGRKAAPGASSGSRLVWRQREVDRKPSVFLKSLARGIRGIANGRRQVRLSKPVIGSLCVTPAREVAYRLLIKGQSEPVIARWPAPEWPLTRSVAKPKGTVCVRNLVARQGVRRGDSNR